MSIRFVLELIPDISRKVFGQKRLSSFGEDWEASELLRLCEMRSAFDLLFSTSSGSSSRLCTSAKLLLLGDHGLDTVVHVLDKIDLRATKSSLVGNVIDVISRFGMLSVDASDLDMEFVSDGLEFWHSNTKFG